MRKRSKGKYYDANVTLSFVDPTQIGIDGFRVEVDPGFENLWEEVKGAVVKISDEHFAYLKRVGQISYNYPANTLRNPGRNRICVQCKV